MEQNTSHNEEKISFETTLVNFLNGTPFILCSTEKERQTVLKSLRIKMLDIIKTEEQRSKDNTSDIIIDTYNTSNPKILVEEYTHTPDDNTIDSSVSWLIKESNDN